MRRPSSRAAAAAGTIGVHGQAADEASGMGVKVPPHQRSALANGVRLILIPRHDVPLIAFEALVRGGARLDPPSRAGGARLTAERRTQGAGSRDAYGFTDAVEGAGGSFDVEARSEAILLHGQFLARDHELMLALLADALQRPHFDSGEFDTLRTRRIEFIKAAKDSEPQSLIGTYGRALLFSGNAYGNPIGGSETSLSCITRQQILQFHDEQFGAERLTLVFAGDLDQGWFKRAVSNAFASWRPAGAALPGVCAAPRAQGRRVLLVDAPGSAQTYFWIANVGVARSYPHRAALELTNTAFGGSFGSMLMQALRVRTGLTYSAHSSFLRGSVPGEFAIGSFAQTASTGRAIDIALQTLDTLKRDGVGDAAIDSSRNYILGQYPLGFETSADWASALAELDLYALPASYIDDFGPELLGVDAADCRQVVDTAFPDSGDVDIVLIGDAARIRGQVSAFGTLVEKPLDAPDFEAPPR